MNDDLEKILTPPLESRRGRSTTVPNEYYDNMFADVPAAPYGAESAAWLATYLYKFDTERLSEASLLARSIDGLDDPKALRDFLGAIWDAVSRELDCTDLSLSEQDQLSRLETQLAQSVHVLRPIVGY